MLNEHDQVIICRDCGEEFDFTVNEQMFYQEKGFDRPVRCKECREKKKAYREALAQEMREHARDEEAA